MNITEAYKIIGVEESISDDALKIKYRELAFKYHPDKGNETNKLASINEAYQFIRDYRENPSKYNQEQAGLYDGFNIQDLFVNLQGNSNSSHSVRNIQPPYINVSISFKESIIGTDKKIEYSRSTKCIPCNGNGFKQLGNDCKKCSGVGRITSNQGNAFFSQTCNACYGRNMRQEKCEKCDGKCTTQDNVVGQVHIPKGTHNGTTLAIRGKGHFTGSGGIFGDTYSDVYVHVNVVKDDKLELVGNDVISRCSITLLQALQGMEIHVPTIHGDHKITIHPLSKNNEEIRIPGLGVKSKGDQRVILSVQYPSNTNKLIDLLSSENN